jgi:hypothetical protein
MTAADNIGLKLDDNSIHWTTISSVDSATTLTAAAGPATAAANGNRVYAYTTKAERPTKIVSAFRRDKNDYDTEITIIGENEYFLQSDKGSTGPPVEVWYQPTMTTGIEWGNALVWNLAAELGSEYGLPEREQGRLWQIAEFKLNELLDYDVENASVEFALETQP